MNDLEKKIAYAFKDTNLLTMALTHSSRANELKKKESSNERLEFLGDSVLNIVVSDYLYKTYTDMPEGELTKQRASLVCEKSLCKFAKEINLGTYLYLGRGEMNTGGRERSSILADTFEAVIAAIYLDSGMEEAARFILGFVQKELECQKKQTFKDYKTILQEVIQQNPEEILSYTLVAESGPDHDKRFTVEVHLNSNCIGKGSGKSKKDAEQHAAREALLLMGYGK